jgi:MoaA/NifB/PqqE/SkfB family radical SAM enzyme
MKCFASTNGFWIDPQGYTRPCARNKERSKHISNFENFGDIKFANITSKLENDVFPDSCFRCKLDEERGIRSKRQYYDAVPMIAPDDFMIDISMGNFCNLKCRMCNPRNSTQWYKEHAGLVAENLIEEKEDNRAYQLKDTDIDKLIAFISTITGNIFIELKGGEPLIMPETKKLVDSFLTLPNANKITLLLVTNGTVVPDWLVRVADVIKDLQLIVSIDGVDNTFDYIRGNNDFSYKKCIENAKLFAKLNNVNLRFNVTVQNLNIHELHLIHQELTQISNKINYITLMLPEYLCVNNISRVYKEKIYAEYLQHREVFGNYADKVDKIYNLMLQDSKPELYKQFLEVTKYLDTSRQQSIETVIPKDML